VSPALGRARRDRPEGIAARRGRAGAAARGVRRLDELLKVDSAAAAGCLGRSESC